MREWQPLIPEPTSEPEEPAKMSFSDFVNAIAEMGCWDPQLAFPGEEYVPLWHIETPRKRASRGWRRHVRRVKARSAR